MKFAIVYFSATHVTKTYADIISQELQAQGCETALFNVTPLSSREMPIPFSEYAGAIFGFPVYSDYAPSVINDWLKTLDGAGKRCGMFFTYGGRTTGYAHFHTKELLERANFSILFSAEFLGPHSYNLGGWSLMASRPNMEDIAVAKSYARLVKDRFSSPELPVLQIQRPFGYYQSLQALGQRKKRTEPRWPHPERFTEDCQMCLRCETECPTGAFDAITGTAELDQCIRCMHCVAICPDSVIRTVEKHRVTTEAFLENCHLTVDMLKMKKSKIISEPWDTVF